MEQVALNTEDLYHTDMPVGEILRRTRLHYGQSLVDIERALRIRASQIEAIENGNYEVLPGKVYAIGFIRSYSEYLGLDGDQMVKIFKQQAGGRTHAPELHFPVSAAESKIPQPWLVAASVILAVGLLFVWGAGGFGSGGRALTETVPPVEKEFAKSQSPDAYGPYLPEDIKPAAAPDPAPEISSQASAQIDQEAPQQQRGITLKISSNSWVEIKDQSGKKIVSRVLEQGDEYFVPDRPDLTMSLGNAGGVQIEIGGTLLKALGEQGDVLRDVPLDMEYLRKNYSGES